MQADVRQFLLSAPFQIEEADLTDVSMESPVGDRRRIDVEAGCAVIEVKRDLRSEKVTSEAEKQLAGYVSYRVQETGLRYIGILTDGVEWRCYDLDQDQLKLVSQISFSEESSDPEKLTVWLEGVLATAKDIAPTANNIEERLGASSSSHALDRSSLMNFYKRNSDNPSVLMKRTLWSRLLTSALGTQFEDTDELFIEHTLLVNTAEIIAHAVLGLPVEALSPASLLSGEKFAEAGIYGVVEQDFFDWIVEVEDGPKFIRTLAKRLNRFVWVDVSEDVLKVLYESIIGADTRKKLGEYYTPDWLAAAVVNEAIVEPLSTKALDPACGSGTFLFHLVRSYILAGEKAGYGANEILSGVTSHVLGMDLHPVAVTLARVTYVLALGRDRLTDPQRGVIQIPVYLGDSLQWQEQSSDLWNAGNLVIETDDNRELFETRLMFPGGLLADSMVFDQLISELAERAAKREPGTKAPSLKSVFTRLAVPNEFRETIEVTFAAMCRLHDAGRNHIWGYYIRNLARPLWLSRESNRVDVVIGNPPWLAYRHMTQDMQAKFRRMSKARNLWAGSEVATHQDLSALFAVRSSELYLKKGGSFAFVMPNAALDRPHYSGFRSGNYSGPGGEIAFSFMESWDLRRVRPHFFPRAASVVFGKRQSHTISENGVPVWGGRKMSTNAEIWTGRLRHSNASWEEASKWFERKQGQVSEVGTRLKSEYAADFTQGAVFNPRLVFYVQFEEVSPLGAPKGIARVTSARSVQEKKPWKELPNLAGAVETEFVRPLYSGDSVLPYRSSATSNIVAPCTAKGPMKINEIEMYPGLNRWWADASQIWEGFRSSDRLDLFDQLDYQSKFTKQFPIPPLRVVYNSSGMHIAAAKVAEPRALISSSLYWASVASDSEADYLCAILNAPVTTELVQPLMSYGKDERHICKHIWDLQVPRFDPKNAEQAELASLGAAAEKIAAEFEVKESLHFSATRRHIRQKINATDVGQRINVIVTNLIPG